MEKYSAYYQIADFTIEVKSDLPFKENTIHEKFDLFKVNGPGQDTVSIHHHFNLLDIDQMDLGREVYRKEPWVIFQQPEAWFYLGILPKEFDEKYWKMAKFNRDHSQGDIYHVGSDDWINGNLKALTTFPSDQILIARLLADRKGCYLHSAGAILNGSGLLFVGHSEAGKSTITQMLLDNNKSNKTGEKFFELEILCDDRNIIRMFDDGWRVYGSWSHGDIPIISADSAPLRAIFILEQSEDNKIIPINNQTEALHHLLAYIIKPFITSDWWEKVLDVIERLAYDVPCYKLNFDKNGKIVNELVEFSEIK